MIQASATNQNAQVFANQNEATQSEQDMLLLAGSKISSQDIYQMERDLPLYKGGKHYRADDVDDLLIMINGIFTSISDQAYRNDKALSTTRAELESMKSSVAAKDNEIKNAQNQVNAAEQRINELQDIVQQANHALEMMKAQSNKDKQTEMQLAHQTQANQSLSEQLTNAQADNQSLTQQLADSKAKYAELVQSSTHKIKDQQDRITKLAKTNAAYADKIESNDNRAKADMSNSSDEYVKLKNEYKILQYRFDKLQKMSAIRIQELSQK